MSLLQKEIESMELLEPLLILVHWFNMKWNYQKERG
jgi:hypothetical protein